MGLFLSTNALLGKTTFAMHTSRSVRWDIIEDKGFSTILRKEGLENFLEGGGGGGEGEGGGLWGGRGGGGGGGGGMGKGWSLWSTGGGVQGL